MNWHKHWSQKINIANIKKIIQNKDLLNKYVTFHADASHDGSTGYSSALLTFKDVIGIINHNKRMLNDTTTGTAPQCDPPQVTLHFVINGQKKKISIDQRSKPILKSPPVSMDAINTMRSFEPHLRNCKKSADILIPNVSSKSLEIMVKFNQLLKKDGPPPMLPNDNDTDLKECLGDEMYNLLDLGFIDSLDLAHSAQFIGSIEVRDWTERMFIQKLQGSNNIKIDEYITKKVIDNGDLINIQVLFDEFDEDKKQDTVL